MHIKLTLLMITAPFFLIGCSEAQRRADESKFIAGYPMIPTWFDKNPNPSDVKMTDRADTYTLCHHWNTWQWVLVVNHEEVLETVELEKGAPIGFDVNAAGEVEAVFGSRRRPLPRANYGWYRKKTAQEVAGEVIANVALGVAIVPLSLAGRH